MNGVDWIKIKQQNWAKRNKVELDKQKLFYTNKLEDNLYLSRLTKETEINFNDADGGELLPKNGTPAKMQALHSSSALAVNVFDYWRQEGKSILPIMASCNLVSDRNMDKYDLQFERKFDILGSNYRPANVDVVFSEQGDHGNIFILESKFSESFQKKNMEMKGQYFADEIIWSQLANIRKEADFTKEYSYFDAGQMIKHLLGTLKERRYKKSGITLCYIYYDVPGDVGKLHFEEIKRFENIIKLDGVKFKHITYQEVIANLIRNYYVNNEYYCDYLSDRYL